jgi:hypothetical protein
MDLKLNSHVHDNNNRGECKVCQKIENDRHVRQMRAVLDWFYSLEKFIKNHQADIEGDEELEQYFQGRRLEAISNVQDKRVNITRHSDIKAVFQTPKR